MYKFILSIADDKTSDCIEAMLNTMRPQEYAVLKAPTLTEAYHWLALSTPADVVLVISGLSESENTTFINQLERTYTRNDYHIVIMDFAVNAVPQVLDLHADGVLVQPFKTHNLLSVVDAFEPVRERIGQLV